MIELEGSMTSFIKQLQGRSPNGPELRKFKDQAAAIAGALFRFAAVRNERTFQIDAKIVSGFELWYPRDERQRVLFPSFVRLSDEYFSTLREHAVRSTIAPSPPCSTTPSCSTSTSGWPAPLPRAS